jgi:hypothetical protein
MATVGAHDEQTDAAAASAASACEAELAVVLDGLACLALLPRPGRTAPPQANLHHGLQEASSQPPGDPVRGTEADALARLCAARRSACLVWGLRLLAAAFPEPGRRRSRTSGPEAVNAAAVAAPGAQTESPLAAAREGEGEGGEAAPLLDLSLSPLAARLASAFLARAADTLQASGAGLEVLDALYAVRCVGRAMRQGWGDRSGEGRGVRPNARMQPSAECAGGPASCAGGRAKVVPGRLRSAHTHRVGLSC